MDGWLVCWFGVEYGGRNQVHIWVSVGLCTQITLWHDTPFCLSVDAVGNQLKNTVVAHPAAPFLRRQDSKTVGS
jgi:hypothetical protein